MSLIKKYSKIIYGKYIEFSTYKAWRKRHNKVFSQIAFSKHNLTENETKDYIAYWGKFNLKVNLDTVVVTKSLTGIYNRHIVPEEIYYLKIEPFYNNRKEINFLANKNIYNKWFGDFFFPKDYFHKINGKYYTSQFKGIMNVEDFISETNFVFPIVFKPSVDSQGGRGVYFVYNKSELITLLNNHENFVVQEKIIQNKAIDEIHDSINTIRVCLLKRPINNEWIVLNASIRMGKDGSLDNETAGGIVCNIKKGGELNEFALDKYGVKFFKHPNSKFVFKNKILPFYSELISSSIQIAEQIIGLNIVSLDMCLNENSDWKCIEVNLFDQTIRFSQYAGNPFFGKYTDEVVNGMFKTE